MISFQEAGLRPELLEAIAKLGFENPTPIQERTLELLQKPSTDMIALAQTGTGKTAAFGLPLLQRIEVDNPNVQALILCPTRELCLQIVSDINDFSRFMGGVKITAIYGGASIDTQIRALRKGTQIVVGTPGRVIDMLSRNELRIQNISWFVLDEADEMLNMGFKDDLESIFEQTPAEKSTWLFSATMPSRVENIAGRYMKDPVKISMGKRNEGASNIQHVYYMVQARDRFEALSRIVAGHEDMYGVVFCRTRTETTDIAEKLSRKGYSAQAINGDLSQQQRDKVMGAFRKGHVRLLVATDVAARGLDVDELTHVVNFNLPDDPEVYVHRSGRTGRAGKSGICVSIIHTREQNRIRDLERMTGKQFEHLQVPLLHEITKFNVLNMADKLLAGTGNIKKMGDIPAAVFMKFEERSREEIIELWTKWAFAQQASQEAGMPDDINATKNSRNSAGREPRAYESRSDRSESRGERSERPSRGADRGADRGDRGGDRGGFERGPKRERTGRDTPGEFTEVELNIGREQYIKPNKIMGIINDMTGNPSINFGRIDIFDDKTFVGVESSHASEVAAALDGMQFGSRKLTARVKKAGESGPRSSEGGFRKRIESDRDAKPRGGAGGYWSNPGANKKKKAANTGGFKKKKKW